MNDEVKLFEKVKKGPVILFLGQAYLKNADGFDPFLDSIVRKYGDGAPEGELSYDAILDTQIAKSNIVESALGWMQNRCDRLDIPPWIKVIGDFSWNSVFTSSIDPVFSRVIRNEWREFHGVYKEDDRPDDYRNRVRLHCTFLYGYVNRSDDRERPPLTKIEKLKRKQVSTLLLNRLPELVTPIGILIVEGYNVVSDWVSMDDWLPIIEKLDKMQTHFFNVKDHFYQNELFSYLVNSNKIIPHEENLSDFLLKGDELGFFKLGSRPYSHDERGTYVAINSKSYQVPKDVFTTVTQTAIILDENIFIEPKKLSEDNLYFEFRNFLSECSNRMMWEGYLRGFNFRRDYEVNLKTEVDKLLKNTKLDNKILLLHGQTGSGKTIALGALAVKIGKEKRFPVLFIERRYENLPYEHIDAFCDWAEEMGADKTLIIWDGMRNWESYRNLRSYLVSRGRKVIIVGSSYKIKDIENLKHSFEFAESTPQLSTVELSRFFGFLDNFDKNLSEIIEKNMSTYDHNFLVALYRLLPSTRKMIRQGMIEELSYTESILREKNPTLEVNLTNFGSLGKELIKAGIIKKDDKFVGDKGINLGSEVLSEMEYLTGLIMIPGRFGLRVPFELLIRSLEKKYSQNVASLFEKFDLFRFSEDVKGNIFVHARHSLEARLIVQSKFGSTKSEMEFIKRLISKVKDEYSDRSNIEIEFILDLLRYIGPNSEEKPKFGTYYNEIYMEFEKLRKERAIHNPRLMLQEAYFMREYVISNDCISVYEKNEILANARKLLNESLKMISNNKSILKSYILIEIASNLGASLHNNPDDANSNYRNLYIDIKDNLNIAQRIDPDSYHAFDVLCWTTEKLLQTPDIDESFRIETEANIIFAFEKVEAENFEILQKQKFAVRKDKIGHLLDNKEMEQEAFDALIKQNSKAGIYLRAKRIVHDLPFDQELTDRQIDDCKRAVEYLQESEKIYGLDGRCFYLLLRLFWMKNTGKPIFFKEKQTVSFTKSNWEYVLSLIDRLYYAGDKSEFVTAPLIYLKGLASFHLGLYNDCFAAFKEISDILAFGNRRVIKSHLASNENGEPIKYNGTVSRIFEDGKGELYVDNIRRTISFSSREFHLQNPLLNETINDFHIAFNFLGLKADPARKVIK